MGKVWGIVNRKGGVGKTTTATTLSYLLAKEWYKVALLDFDGQRHSTKLCGKAYGILQPIIVWHREDKYILLSGHNRVNAGKLARLTKCAAVVKENLAYEDAVLIVTETNLC